MKQFYHREGRNGTLSSVRIEENPRHWHFHIWNRGAKAGVLCVEAKDGPFILDHLLPPRVRIEAEPETANEGAE